MKSLKAVLAIRALNAAKCSAAGVGAGTYSELDNPRVGKRKGPRRRHKVSASKKAHKKNKPVSQIRAERDALYGSRRVPGSFEGGARR